MFKQVTVNVQRRRPNKVERGLFTLVNLIRAVELLSGGSVSTIFTTLWTNKNKEQRLQSCVLLNQLTHSRLIKSDKTFLYFSGIFKEPKEQIELMYTFFL